MSWSSCILQNFTCNGRFLSGGKFGITVKETHNIKLHYITYLCKVCLHKWRSKGRSMNIHGVIKCQTWSEKIHIGVLNVSDKAMICVVYIYLYICLMKFSEKTVKTNEQSYRKCFEKKMQKCRNINCYYSRSSWILSTEEECPFILYHAWYVITRQFHLIASHRTTIYEFNLNIYASFNHSIGQQYCHICIIYISTAMILTI